jgi:hypothetical protein
VTAAVLGVVLLAASAAWGEEPLRLLLEREPAAQEGECLRGTLSVVRSFSSADTERAVRIADFLEIPSGSDSVWLRAGTHVGVARDDEETGWRIEIEEPDGLRALRAPPPSDLGEEEGSVLVGRRVAPAPTGDCDPSVERLEDGGVLMRRLRQVYASPTNERPIEIEIRPLATTSSSRTPGSISPDFEGEACLPGGPCPGATRFVSTVVREPGNRPSQVEYRRDFL